MKPGDPFNPRRMFVGVFIPDAILNEQALSMGAKFLYGFLVKLSADKGHCWPTQRALAKHLGCSEREVRNRIKELTKYGLVAASRSAPGKPARYVFLWHEMFANAAKPGENFADLGGTNVPVRAERLFRLDRNKRSGAQSPHLADNAGDNHENSRRQEKQYKRNITRETDVYNPPIVPPTSSAALGQSPNASPAEGGTAKRKTRKQREQEEQLAKLEKVWKQLEAKYGPIRTDAAGTA